MAVKDYMRPGLTDRQRVRILTVDPPTRRVEASIKDGSMIQIAVWDTPNAFRWPLVNEIWLVRRDNGIWMLDCKQDGEVTGSGADTLLGPEPAPIEQMAPGGMRLDSHMVQDAAGKTFVAVDLTGIEDGWTLKWDATSKSFVASP